MTAEHEKTWSDLSPEGKRRCLFEKQKALLQTFLERNAISREQYEQGLQYMTRKMGYAE